MTIETSSAQQTSRPATTEPKHSKPKMGDATGSSGPGGFMSILASLDTTEVPAPLATDIALPGNESLGTALAVLQLSSLTLKAATRELGALDIAGDVDPSIIETDPHKLLLSSGVETGAASVFKPLDLPLQQELPVETSALLAQAAQWNLITPRSMVTLPLNTVDTSALLAQGGQWTAAPNASAEQALPIALAGAIANFSGALKLPPGISKPEGLANIGSALGEHAADVVGKAGKTQKDAFARLASAQVSLADPGVPNSPTAQVRQAQVLQRLVDGPLNPIASAPSNVVITAPVSREDQMRERSVFRSTAPDLASPVQTYTPSSSTSSFANPATPVSSMDTYVAEKVAYWISNDVQNAEMKLEGIGELPVEVSIRMQGNEAHIAFRSDELQARAVLENASQDLKDMLQREGLVLSGVSVGTSGAGDGRDQERKSRQGERQAGVVSVQPVRADSVTGSSRSAGGGLDLFV